MFSPIFNVETVSAVTNAHRFHADRLDSAACGAGPNAANALCGSGKLGVDLQQLVVTSTAAYTFSEQHSIGVSPLLVHQKFKACGLQAFTPMSSEPSKLSNNGYSSSTGVGVQFGQKF